MSIKFSKGSIHQVLLGASCAALCSVICSACASSDDPSDKNKSDVTTSSSHPEPTTAAPSAAPSNEPSNPLPMSADEVVLVEPMGKRLGHFDVTLNQDSTSFSGLMHSAPDNETVSYDVVSKDGDCELRTPKVFTCDPVCSADQDCTTDRQCAPRPETASVGTLTVDGIQKRDQTAHFTLEPLNATTNRYNVAGLGAPAFAAGDVLTLSAQGGALEPFTISVVGIDVLMAKSVDPIPFEPGKPAEVTWVAGDPKLGQIVLTVDVGHHGGSQAEIVCNVEDTGSAQIAGSLVTGLTDLGVAGFPLVTVERRAANYANLSAGYAEFTLSSPLTLSLAIPGVQSCNTDADCENGQTCKMPNLQCVDP